MLRVSVPEGGFRAEEAAALVEASGLVELFEGKAPGPFGPSALGLRALEALGQAVDIGWAARQAVRGLIVEHLEGGPSFRVPRLERAHREFLSACQLIAQVDVWRRRLGAFLALEPPQGELELEGLPDLLGAEQSAAELSGRVLGLAAAWGRGHVEIDGRAEAPAGAQLAAGVWAFGELLRRALLRLCEQTQLRPMARALAAEGLEIAGYPYEGLRIQEVRGEQVSGLLGVGPGDIVGNEEYLRAGMCLARDVAGFDLEAGRNPKRVNPILFGLGEPGCGKTVTAHAVGHYFLEFCRARQIPARFQIIQRTDWASSYQNASAMNLVQIFREQVHGFEGVCGVYWPDIDTAFASRQSGQLRSEEKQNLGAVFGVFDGTLLPRDGSWFLLCDANTMHMDEATISRIAQNPMTVRGPTTDEHYAVMMHELQLADVAEFVDLDERGWMRVGARARALGMSGRDVEAVCGNIRAYIQDFEYPEAYFQASGDERAQIVRGLCRRVSERRVLEELEAWASFRREADAQAEEERFHQEVEGIVRRLNASRAASALLGQGGE